MRKKQYKITMKGRMNEYIRGRISGIIGAVSCVHRQECGYALCVMDDTTMFRFDANWFQYRHICKIITKLYSHMFEITF